MDEAMTDLRLPTGRHYGLFRFGDQTRGVVIAHLHAVRALAAALAERGEVDVE